MSRTVAILVLVLSALVTLPSTAGAEDTPATDLWQRWMDTYAPSGPSNNYDLADLCPNVDGAQTELTRPYFFNGMSDPSHQPQKYTCGRLDACKNLAGEQTTIPAGVALVKYAGSRGYQSTTGTNGVADMTSTECQAVGDQIVDFRTMDFPPRSDAPRTGIDGTQNGINVFFSPGAIGTALDDYIFAYPGGKLDGVAITQTPVRLDGAGGNDSVFGRGGADVLVGGSGADKVSGYGGDDVMNGGDGADSLDGGAGMDRLIGGAGNDTLNGSLGRDTLLGGAGNDRLDAREGRGGDVVNCGPGRDTAIVDRGDTVLGCERVTRAAS